MANARSQKELFVNNVHRLSILTFVHIHEFSVVAIILTVFFEHQRTSFEKYSILVRVCQVIERACGGDFNLRNELIDSFTCCGPTNFMAMK